MAARNNNIWKCGYIFQGLYVGLIRIFINLFHPFRLGNIELQQINYILIHNRMSITSFQTLVVFPYILANLNYQ